jgi:hypothetical protein
MGYNVAGGTSNMLKSGHSSAQGLDEAVLRNIEAAKVFISYICFIFQQRAYICFLSFGRDPSSFCKMSFSV